MTRREKIVLTSNVIAAAAVVAIIVFVILPYMTAHMLDLEVDRSHYPVKGIDVSHHNKEIDFEKVKNDTVSFVYIKASDGVGDKDARLTRNYHGAKAFGFDVGFYHYFRYHRDGHQQAQYFLQTIKGMDTELPLVIDIEEKDNKTEELPLVTRRVRDMVYDLRKAGYRVMLYVNPHQYESIVKGHFDDVELWVASSRSPQESIPQRRLWQHSHWGKVDGIEHETDINVFNGTREEYDAWVKGESTPSPNKNNTQYSKSDNNNQQQ